MHVIFVELAFPIYQRKFVRTLAQQGARVSGIGERPLEFLDDALRGWVSHCEQIGSVTDTEALQHGVVCQQPRLDVL